MSLNILICFCGLGFHGEQISSQDLYREMNDAFAHLPKGVICRCKCSHWPKDVKLAGNVKIMVWIPQTDLLGKH